MGTIRFLVNDYFGVRMVSIGERLREERQRLGMSQPVFGEVAGVTKKTQMLYESGERSPDAAYLAAIAAAGADVQYIVTGMRSDMALTPDERELMALFRSASLSGKAAAIGALQGVAAAAPMHKNITVSGGAGNQVAGGSIKNKGGGKR